MITTIIRDLVKYYHVPDYNNSNKLVMYPFYNTSKEYIYIKTNTKMKVLSELMLAQVEDNLDHIIDYKMQDVLNATLERAKFPLIWFYDSADTIQKLFVATFSSYSAYSKVVKLYAQSDPQTDKRRLWNITQLPALFCFGQVSLNTSHHTKWTLENTPNMHNLVKFFQNIVETKYAGKFITDQVQEAIDD